MAKNRAMKKDEAMEKMWAYAAEFVGTALRNLARQGVLVSVLAGGIFGLYWLMDKQNQGTQTRVIGLEADVQTLQKKWLDCEAVRYEQGVELARQGEQIKVIRAQLDAQATALSRRRQ